MRRVINFETYHEVRRLSRELNLIPSQIAAETGLNIKTIRKWLDKPRFEPRSKATRRTSKLDPYKDLIISWLEKHPYTGMQIFQRLRAEHGYTGGRSILHDFIATVRPVRHQAFLKLAFEPGDCMSSSGSRLNKVALHITLSGRTTHAAAYSKSLNGNIRVSLSAGDVAS